MLELLARPGSRAAALVAVIALGAVLRFAGLSHEARHPQHYDDRVFVNNVIEMLAAGDLDHRYYEYPGLFYYLLALPVALSRPERIDDPGAVLAARALVATFGVLSIVLVYQLGRRLQGPGVGLAAALFLAVSPNEVAASHTNRPDVVLQTVTLVACLGLLGLGPDRCSDIRAAVGLGAATAIKFTGFLLFPSYVLARLLAPGPRLARIILVAVIATLVVLAATPYALVHPESYLGGVSHQMGAHYQSSMTVATYLANLGAYARWIVEPLGVPLVALSLVGAASSLRGGPRDFLPLLAHLPLTVLVMSSAGIVAPRFLIPASGAIFLAAGLGLRALTRGRAPAALVLGLLAAFMPLSESLDRVRPLLQPSPRDGALDWIDAHLKAGSRILETRQDALSDRRAQLIGADPRRYELLFHFPPERGLQLLAQDVDLVIVGPGGGTRWAEELPTVYRGTRDGQALFELKQTRRADRPRYVALDARGVRPSASLGEDRAGALVDGDLGTIWTTSRSMAAGDWIELSWDDPRPLARVELRIANRPDRDPDLRVFTRDADGTFRQRTAVAARESVTRQLEASRPPSQVFLLQPEPAFGLRIQVEDGPSAPWALKEVELSVRAAGATGPGN